MVIRSAGGLVVLVGLASPALAQDCRLALVLALDVSASVDAAEYSLQRNGLTQAIIAPEVRRAFLSGAPVALYVFEWSGVDLQAPVGSGWQMIRDREDLDRAVHIIAQSQTDLSSHPMSRTAIGAALEHAASALESAPDCSAWTVDVSADGISNHGRDPQDVYAVGALDGVTVNALVVGGPHGSHQLIEWFRGNVLHGSRSFWILADGYEDYERAMTAKLLHELELPLVSGWPLLAGGA